MYIKQSAMPDFGVADCFLYVIAIFVGDKS